MIDLGSYNLILVYREQQRMTQKTGDKSWWGEMGQQEKLPLLKAKKSQAN